MARAGEVLVATLDLIAGHDPPRREHRRARRGRRALHPLAAAATPTFKGYRGFPGSICASPNAMIVHGIPGPYRLKARRHHLDRRRRHARRLGRRRRPHVPRRARSTRQRQNLLAATEESLHAGVAQCRPGNRIGDVSQRDPDGRRGRRAWRSCARSSATASGRSMHEDPQVPNYGKPGKGPLLEEGMVLAIEPMTTAGRPGGAGRPATAGRSSPRTARRRRTSSSRSRSPPRARACSRPGTSPAAERAGRRVGRPAAR